MQRRDHRGKSAILKLRDARQETLQNAAISGGKGTIGCVAVLNNTAWKETPKEEGRVEAISVEDLPRLNADCTAWENVGEEASNFQALPDLSNYKI
jgi:hypothetical protein